MTFYEEQYALYKNAVDEALRNLPMLSGAMQDGKPVTRVTQRPPEDNSVPQPLKSAMAYSLFMGGKRLRPVLTLAAYALIKDDWESAMPFANAVEMLHTYSLIHDDLPALDNDELRRGAPTSHVVFGEDMAILAGDALLTAAFEIMLSAAESFSDSARALRAIGVIARSVGVTGMIAGQTLDVKLEGEAPTEALVGYIHRHKTADLISGATECGLILAGADNVQALAGARFGRLLGTAFQIVDDLIDICGDESSVGKTLGKDISQGKMTWPSVFGEEKSREDARLLIDDAVATLEPFGQRATFLRQLALGTLVRKS